MFRFEGRTYKTPMDISRDAKYLRKQGRIEEAEKLLQAAIRKCPKNIFFYNQLLSCIENPDKAWTVYRQMQGEKLIADIFTYNNLIDIFCKAGQAKKVLAVFTEMKKDNVKINVKIYNNIINLLVRVGKTGKAWEIFMEMEKNKIAPNTHTYVALINLFGKTGQTDQVWNIFIEAQNKKITTNAFFYSTLINILGKYELVDKAWEVFEEMQRDKIISDAITYKILINVFYSANRQKEITKKLNPDNLPIEALPAYCDALRKSKQYKKCIHWCDFVSKNSSDEKLKEHAWIIKLCCHLHFDVTKFQDNVGAFQIMPSSVHYPRFIATKVFGMAYRPEEKDEIKTTLQTALMGNRGESSRKDLEKALNLLS